MQVQGLRNIFLGVKPPLAVCNALHEIQQSLTAYYDAKLIHWVPSESLCIPFKRFGPLSDHQIIEKKSIIEQLFKEQTFQPFIISLDALDVSPSWNKPRSLICTVRSTPKVSTKKLIKTLDESFTSELVFENYVPAANEQYKRSSPPLKCILGEWKKIYSPSLRGTAFRQGCTSFARFASFEVNEVFLMSEFPSHDDDEPSKIDIIEKYMFKNK